MSALQAILGFIAMGVERSELIHMYMHCNLQLLKYA